VAGIIAFRLIEIKQISFLFVFSGGRVIALINVGGRFGKDHIFIPMPGLCLYRYREAKYGDENGYSFEHY
jgi:hypothetical protein